MLCLPVHPSVSSSQAFTTTKDLLVTTPVGPFSSSLSLDFPVVWTLAFLPFLLEHFFSFDFHAVTFFGFSLCLWEAVEHHS